MRKRTGCAYCVDGVWHSRVTAPDGKRSNPMALPGYSEAKGREKAVVLTVLAAKNGGTRNAKSPPATRSTVGRFAWFASRERRGFDVAHERGGFNKWVLDDLGAGPGDFKLAAKHANSSSIPQGSKALLRDRKRQDATRKDLVWAMSVSFTRLTDDFTMHPFSE